MVLSEGDEGESVLCLSPSFWWFDHLQFILNRAARGLLLKSKSDHGPPLLQELTFHLG